MSDTSESVAHGRILAEVIRLTRERDEAQAEIARSFSEVVRLYALLREWRDLDPLGPPPSEDLLDRTDAALEGR